MNGFLRPLFTLSLLAILAVGCSKKKPEAASGQPTPAIKAASPSQKEKSKAAASAEKPGKAAQAPAVENAALPADRPVASGPETLIGNPGPADPLKEAASEEAKFEAWFKKYNLDFSDPKMLDEDADGDGFSNREEFMADTNPRDPNSRPGVAADIRMQEYKQEDLPFILRAVQGDTAKIEREEGGAKRTETVRAGQPLPGSTFRIAKVRPTSDDDRDKDGNKIDGSSVTLVDPEGKNSVVLRKDLSARSSATYAVIVSPDGKQKMTVHQDETFTWPGQPPVTYRVVDLREASVILQNVANGKSVTVPKAP